jgi:hypothetical protein
MIRRNPNDDIRTASPTTPPPDKTLEELAKITGAAVLHPHYEQYGKSYYEDVDRAARYISKAITDATADLRAEVERLRRNAIVSHLMQGELETQLATERERNENIAKFGRLLVGELIQGEWTPDDEWRDEMVSKGEELGLIGRRQPGEDDDQDLQYIWTNLTTPPSATEGQT